MPQAILGTPIRKRRARGDMGKTRGRPPKSGKDRHKEVPIMMRVQEHFKDALQKVADRERRSLSQTCVLLLEEIMRTKEGWKPPPLVNGEV